MLFNCSTSYWGVKGYGFLSYEHNQNTICFLVSDILWNKFILCMLTKNGKLWLLQDIFEWMNVSFRQA